MRPSTSTWGWVCPSIFLSIHPSIRPSVCPSEMHSWNQLKLSSTLMFMNGNGLRRVLRCALASLWGLVRLSFRPFVPLSVCSSVRHSKFCQFLWIESEWEKVMMIHVHPHNHNKNDHDRHDDNDNHNHHNYHNKTMKKTRRIFVCQNLLRSSCLYNCRYHCCC